MSPERIAGSTPDGTPVLGPGAAPDGPACGLAGHHYGTTDHPGPGRG